jgi:hypothetical protein
MPDIATGVGIGAPVIGGLLGSKSASSQQKAVTGGLDQSTQLQREQFDYLKQILAPYQEAGTQALPALTGFINQPQQNFSFDYGAYFNSPEYAALSQQSEQAAMRNASATGGLRGGDTQVALASIAPQLAQMARQNAQQEFSLNQGANLNRYNMLQGIAGLGTGATSQLGNAAQNFGQIAGQNAALAGQARADAIGQRNNALGGGLAGLLSLF